MKAKWIPFMLSALMVALSACSSGSSGKTDTSAAATNSPAASKDAAGGPFDRYSQQVDLKIAKSAPSQNTNMPAGDTPDDNEFYRDIFKDLNVKVTNDWRTETPDAYNQKMAVSIASRDLPDAFVVTEEQLKQLVQAGQIEDLSDAYNKYASKEYKDYYNSYDKRVLGRATFDGKLMALPATNIGYQFDEVWLRQDWMDKLGLQPPKTLDDLVNIAKAFVERDPDGNGKADTYGFPGIPQIYGPTQFSFEPIMGALNAYGGRWLPDASGKVTYSSIMPEMKTALAKLQELYKAGLIDKEFAVRKDVKELVNSGQVGIVFGPWYTPNSYLANSVKNNPKAEWKPYLAPLDANGKFNVNDQNPVGNFLVVRKGYEHPEAVVKVMNWEIDTQNHFPEKPDIYKGLGVQWTYQPFAIQIDSEFTVYETHMELKKAVEAKDKSLLADERKSWYDTVMKDKANPRQDSVAYAFSIARLDGADLVGSKQVEMHHNAFFGVTPTMATKWANLQKLENETFLKIIMGELPVSEFDHFVTQWKQLGGDQITQEVQKEAIITK